MLCNSSLISLELKYYDKSSCAEKISCDMMRVEERPPIRGVAANIFNKQSSTAYKRRSSSLGVGHGANNSSPSKRSMLLAIPKESLGPVFGHL